MSVRDPRKMAAAMLTFVAGVAVGAGAQSVGPHHGFLGGPWEVLVKMGHEGQTLRLPLSVRDESKPQEMDAVLPVGGASVTVRVKRFLPNLAWETIAVDDPEGGAAVRLSLRGESLHQDLWLSGRDRERQSVSAQIGSVALRELPSGTAAVASIERLTGPDTVGILLVWLREADPPLVYGVQPGRSVALPGPDGKLTIARYVPHYSIDRTTKQVTSLSQEPVNPAIEVCVQRGGREYRQWLWSQFAISPHRIEGLPFRAKFLDFNLGGSAGRYLLAVMPDGPAFALYARDGKRRHEWIELGKRYPFTDERYSFVVEEIRRGAALVNTWKNSSEVLLRPALVAEITEGAETREVVLELNQPCHHKTAQGTLVVLYRRIP